MFFWYINVFFFWCYGFECIFTSFPKLIWNILNKPLTYIDISMQVTLSVFVISSLLFLELNLVTSHCRWPQYTSKFVKNCAILTEKITLFVKSMFVFQKIILINVVYVLAILSSSKTNPCIYKQMFLSFKPSLWGFQNFIMIINIIIIIKQ